MRCWGWRGPGLATVRALLAAARACRVGSDEAKRDAILPGTGRGTSALVEGAAARRSLADAPSTSLRLAVPLPVPGRI